MEEASSTLAAGLLPGTTSSGMSSEDLRPPPCIIVWSDQVARAVEDLLHAVVVSVIGDGPLASVEEVAAAIVSRIEVVASSLMLRQASSSSYLLVLPELAMVERLVGLRQLIRSSGVNFSQICKSRLSAAMESNMDELGRVLPGNVNLILVAMPRGPVDDPVPDEAAAIAAVLDAEVVP